MISDLQVVSSCDNHLPVAGGLLDQSAWFLELRNLLKREETLVEREQNERRR